VTPSSRPRAPFGVLEDEREPFEGSQVRVVQVLDSDAPEAEIDRLLGPDRARLADLEAGAVVEGDARSQPFDGVESPEGRLRFDLLDQDVRESVKVVAPLRRSVAKRPIRRQQSGPPAGIEQSGGRIWMILPGRSGNGSSPDIHSAVT
jgi:hypothetical protein